MDPKRRSPKPFTLAEELRWRDLVPATDAQVEDVRSQYLDADAFPKSRTWLAQPRAATRLSDVSASIGERVERLLRERRGGPISLLDDPEAQARFAAIAGRLATPEQAAEASATGLAVVRFLVPLLALDRALPAVNADLHAALQQGKTAFEARLREALTPERVMAELGLALDDKQAQALRPAVQARQQEVTGLYEAASRYFASPATAGLLPFVDAVLEDLDNTMTLHNSMRERL